MISYLPTLYPDELVYSWFCRYYVHTGFPNHKAALNEILFARCNNPSKEFVGHLNPSMQAAITERISFRDLLLEHTMFGQYGRFIPLEKKEKALYRLEHDFCDVHHLFTVLPRSAADQFLKYCPLCVKEERLHYGEAYWHRKHQLRSISVCHKHGCYLEHSTVTAKSEQTFTFSPAEYYVNEARPRICENQSLLQYTAFATAVFDSPVSLDVEIPFRAALFAAMKKRGYVKPSERSRYTLRFSEELSAFYQAMGMENTATMSQIQKVLLGTGTEFSVVCQIAYFLGIDADDLLKPDITEQELEQEQRSHFVRDREVPDWTRYDAEMALMLERFLKAVYDGTDSDIGRPERVSERLIYRRLKLPGHRLENMPKCREILRQYEESYEENWARRIIWAYRKLRKENAEKEIYWSDIRVLSGVKKKNIEKVMPYMEKLCDFETIRAIKEIVK